MISVKFLELAQSELDDVFEAYEYQRGKFGIYLYTRSD